jgi:hypothetical protein
MRALLVVSHPGHELRLHHWMERVRPDVLVLTDGSGSAGAARIASTQAVLDRAGARLLDGDTTVPDARVYRALRERDTGFFAAMAASVCRHVAGGYDLVACDGLEGFNTSHDLCHYLVVAAAARQPEAARPEVREFPLEAPPASWAGVSSDVLALDEPALARKVRAALAYTELAAEVRSSLTHLGAAAFAIEALRRVRPGPDPNAPPGAPPHYETFGERRVREGVYPEVIRWADHVRPVVNHIWPQPGGAPCGC